MNTCLNLKNFFQLHTVHQEPDQLVEKFKSIGLSTPHGTLGTDKKRKDPRGIKTAFQLHTVHQERRTCKNPEQISNLSTPHGTLGTEEIKNTYGVEIPLSTPHGTLGTVKLKGPNY